MTISVTHTKVSSIPDGADTDLIRPSDWNASHTLTGVGTMAEQNANNVAITGGAINGTTIGATTATTVTGTVVTGSTKVVSPYFDANSSAGGALRNASGTNQIQWGSGGGNNVSIDASTNLNGSNAQIDISPTGTGHVHIKPTGAGSLEIAPTSAGTMDNMAVGQTTAAAGKFTNFEVTGTFKVDNAEGTTGQVLTSQGAGVTPVWTTPTTGTVTSVTGTAPIASSGGNTPAISISQATTSTNGYLSSTDWNTFNNKVSMTYPGAGIPNSTGSAWGTSYTTSGSGTVLALTTSPSFTTPVLGTPTSGNLSNCTVDGTYSIGYRNVPAVGTKTSSYSLTTSDVGKYVQVGSGGSITIPDATFAEGDIVSVFNNTSGNITITCSITTAYISGTDADKSTMTLATRGVATILFISGTVCVVSGNVS